jgi:Cytochrome P450
MGLGKCHDRGVWNGGLGEAQEVDSVPKGYIPSVDELYTSMPYVNAVFKETLRLYPVAIVTIRALGEDCNLLGYNFKKGTPVHVRFLDVYLYLIFFVISVIPKIFLLV